MAGAGFTSYVELNNQAPLVVIDDTTPEKSVKSSGIQASGAGENSEQLITLADDPTGDTENENRNKTKLCGYLNKYKRGARGIGKIFKRRWFIYSENTCKLLYYRTPQDIVPLGEIDISNATLSFEVGEGNSVGGRTNVFEISCGTRVYYLEAPDQQTMMYWLQQLQAKRRAFSYKKTRDSTDKAQLKTIQQPSAGLVGKNNLLASGDHKDSAMLMTPVELPSETIGEGAASSQSKNPLSDISISNWKTELRNALANIRSKRQSDSDAHMSRSPRSLSPAVRNANTSEEKPDNIQKLTRFESFKRRMRTKSQDMDSLGVNLSGSTESLCGRCKQFETAAAQHQEELMGAEEELVATRELVRILQKDIDVEQRQKKTKNAINGNGTPEDQLAVLQAKDKTIVELEHLVATVKEDKEIANVELKMLESKVESLEQELEMYRESLRSKDEIVMSLTNTIFQLESSQRSAEKTNAATNTTLKGKPVDALELERLRDAVSAYTLQNKFLNKEILELNKLRADDEARERQLFMKCTQWEAYYYQINSKYLLCLEQLRIPQRETRADPDPATKAVTMNGKIGNNIFRDFFQLPQKPNGELQDFLNKDDRFVKAVEYFKTRKRELHHFTRKLEDKFSSLSIWSFSDPEPDHCCSCDENIYVLVDLDDEPAKGNSTTVIHESPIVRIINCPEIDSKSPSICSRIQHSKHSSNIEGEEKHFPDFFLLGKKPHKLDEKIEDLASLEKLFLGLDIFCRFIFLQVALYKDAPLCLLCDSHRVVGHSVSIEDTDTYVISADIKRLTLEIAKGGEGASQEVVTQLLNDAMDLQNSGDYYEDLLTSQSLPYPVSPKRQTKKYDKYGFLVMPRTGEDLVEKAQTLQRKSNELLGKDVDKEITQNIRWENMFVSLGNRELQRTQELKNLIRNGVPYQHKERVWNACISFRVGALRERLGGCYYQNLLDAVDQQSHRHNPALKQIELDLLRTLPNNHHYESMSSDGIPKLKRVLRAYTQHNPDLGYCQGQNRLAAIALLFLNEEDAFWCLLAITEFLMPVDYYSRTLSAAQVDQRVFKDLMLDKMPHLMSHLESQDIDVTLFTFNWFLTIFVDNIPTETYLRVWDSFLYEGNKVLFRFALAFFKYREKEMLAIKDNVGLHNYLRTLGENATDLCKIAQIAFQEVNPLPMRFIEGRRHAHMVQVKNELAELEALRSQFRSSRRNVSHASNDFVSDDET